MELLISDEQRSLVETVREWLSEVTDLAEARADGGTGAGGKEAALRAAGGIGLLGLLRPKEGGGYVDAGLIAEETGRAASPLPLAQVALACRVLDELGLGGADADAAAEGSLLLVPAVPEPGEAPIRAAAGAEGSLTLSGRASFVIAGSAAGRLLAVARAGHGDGAVFALLDPDAPGVTRTRRTVLDVSRDFAAVRFDSARVAPGRWAAAPEALADRLVDACTAFHAADAVGAAQKLLEMTVAYVKERRQFDRPVGGFQAVKHHCANMAVDVESARVSVRAAVRGLESADPAARGAAVSSAAALAGEACSRAAGLALQLHGGMGFTWEHDLHLYLRRIKTAELLGGTPRHHRERLLRLSA